MPKGIQQTSRYMPCIWVNRPHTLYTMEHFRRFKQWTVVLWCILLSLSLILAQGVTLHVHHQDHDHHTHHHHGHDLIDSAHDAEHSHSSKAHFSLDASHDDHHNEIITEVDVSPNGLLKAPGTQVLFFVFITFVLLLTLPTSTRRAPRHRRESHPYHYLCYLFSPPLRAPPR